MSEDIEEKIKSRYINLENLEVDYIQKHIIHRSYNIIFDMFISKKHYKINFAYDYEDNLTFDANIDNICSIIDKYILMCFRGGFRNEKK